MLIDFDRFVISCKLAYRRCGGSENNAYSMKDVLWVFRYYFETYELIFNEPHPMISVQQIANIIEKMPIVDDGPEDIDNIELTPEDYETLIDQHFVTKYKGCDYNINHFFSGCIRKMRYFETLYYEEEKEIEP